MKKHEVKDKELEKWFDSRVSWTDELYHEGFFGKYLYSYWKRYLMPYIRIFRKNNLTEKPNVLDVGIGTGHLLLTIGKYFYPKAELYGLDISNEMIKATNKKLKKEGLQADLRHGLADKNPFKDNKFDVVFAHAIIHHIPKERQQKAIKELIRVAKPQGFICMNFPDSMAFRKNRKSTETIIPKGNKTIYEYTYTEKDLRKLIENSLDGAELIDFASAEGWGYRRITDILRSLNFKYHFPKFLLYWLTAIQIILLSHGIGKRWKRGYRVVLQKKNGLNEFY